MVEYQTGIEINMFKLLKLSHMGDSENTEKSMVTIFVMEKGLIVLIHRKIHGVKRRYRAKRDSMLRLRFLVPFRYTR